MEQIRTSIPASGDGITLSLLATVPAEAPKAVVQFVHGMAEHKERYLPVMEFLSGKGFVCVINDLRGHGESVASPDGLGSFSKGGFKGATLDEFAVTTWCKENYPGIPVFLFGHSMGSLLVREYCKEHDSDISGLVVCGSPSANSAAGIGKVIARLIWMFNGWKYRSPMLASMALGGYSRKFSKEGSRNAWICSDKAVVDAYDADPLCGFNFTVNGYYNLFGLLKDTYSEKGWQVRNPSLPVLFIAGAKDPCIDGIRKFSRAVDFMRGRGYTDVSAKVYPDMRHEILNEKGKQAVWDDVASALGSWLSKIR